MDTPAANPAPAPVAPVAAAAPPSAEIIEHGEISEDDFRQLQNELQTTRQKLADIEAEKRRVEINAAHLENENIELRKIPTGKTRPKNKFFID